MFILNMFGLLPLILAVHILQNSHILKTNLDIHQKPLPLKASITQKPMISPTNTPTPTIIYTSTSQYQNYGWYIHNGQSMQYVNGSWFTTPQQAVTSTQTYQNYGWYIHDGQSMQYVNGSWYTTAQQNITPSPAPAPHKVCTDYLSTSWCDTCKLDGLDTDQCLAWYVNRSY